MQQLILRKSTCDWTLWVPFAHAVHWLINKTVFLHSPNVNSQQAHYPNSWPVEGTEANQFTTRYNPPASEYQIAGVTRVPPTSISQQNWYATPPSDKTCKTLPPIETFPKDVYVAFWQAKGALGIVICCPLTVLFSVAWHTVVVIHLLHVDAPGCGTPVIKKNIG